MDEVHGSILDARDQMPFLEVEWRSNGERVARIGSKGKGLYKAKWPNLKSKFLKNLMHKFFGLCLGFYLVFWYSF